MASKANNEPRSNLVGGATEDVEKPVEEESRPTTTTTPPPPTTTTTTTATKQPKQSFIAVRRGHRGLQSCIFLQWDDARVFLGDGTGESNAADDVEYAVVDTLEAAREYLGGVQDGAPSVEATTTPTTETDVQQDTGTALTDTEEHTSKRKKQPVGTQKKKKKRKRSPYEEEEAEDLRSNSRRFMKPNAKWYRRYEAIQQYKDTHDGQWPTLSGMTSKETVPKGSPPTTSTQKADGPPDTPAVGTSTNFESNSNTSSYKENSTISVEDLVKWMETQRYHYRLMKEGKKACMNPIKIQLLREIDFDFKYCSWDRYLDELQRIQQNFVRISRSAKGNRQNNNNNNNKDAEEEAEGSPETLEEYLEKVLVHPFCNRRYDDNDAHDDQKTKEQNSVSYHDLGKWFYKQREQCRLFLQGKPCTITKPQMERLFALGVCNPVQLVQPKQKKFKKSVLLKQEKAEHQRTTKLEQESQFFETMFAELEQYKQIHGTTHVPKALNTPLSKWVVSIKNMYRRLRQSRSSSSNDSRNQDNDSTRSTTNKGGGPSILTAERIQRLNDLGFVFAMTEKQPYLKFQEWVERLRTFQQSQGHCRVPHDYPEDPGLSAWVHRQRNEYRKYTEQLALGEEVVAARPYASKYEAKSTLTPERIQTLNDMGFLWQVAKRTGSFFGADRKSWDERFQELVDYKNLHGHTLVPQAYPKLGEWVKRQRRCYKFLKEGKKQPNLTAGQALRLQQIGFVFDVRKQQRQQKNTEELKQHEKEVQQRARQRVREQQHQMNQNQQQQQILQQHGMHLQQHQRNQQALQHQQQLQQRQHVLQQAQRQVPIPIPLLQAQVALQQHTELNTNQQAGKSLAETQPKHQSTQDTQNRQAPPDRYWPL